MELAHLLSAISDEPITQHILYAQMIINQKWPSLIKLERRVQTLDCRSTLMYDDGEWWCCIMTYRHRTNSHVSCIYVLVCGSSGTIQVQSCIEIHLGCRHSLAVAVHRHCRFVWTLSIGALSYGSMRGPWSSARHRLEVWQCVCVCVALLCDACITLFGICICMFKLYCKLKMHDW